MVSCGSAASLIGRGHRGLASIAGRFAGLAHGTTAAPFRRARFI